MNDRNIHDATVSNMLLSPVQSRSSVAPNMEYLSASTRKKQTALLIFCLTSVSVSVFRLRLTKLENAGFDILVPEYLLSFVLVLSVLYLFISYAVFCLKKKNEYLSTNQKVKSERDGIARTID
ncbi:hypothetical protein DEA8626_00011 [Defluviimonas aquaemixtae]|uniref:Uncharacterized protein n=1 Tax=Albidovulum aquaemixtae TaxID=1542388 RepID=A0A2R8B1T6_9RHOB|nr:hypothetical protein DEA8626_00011 [Defluviimonas aquaemixtae]